MKRGGRGGGGGGGRGSGGCLLVRIKDSSFVRCVVLSIYKKKYFFLFVFYLFNKNKWLRDIGKNGGGGGGGVSL